MLDHADAACSISITQPDAGRPFTGFKPEPLPPKPNNTEALGFASWAVSNVVTGPASQQSQEAHSLCLHIFI